MFCDTNAHQIEQNYTYQSVKQIIVESVEALKKISPSNQQVNYYNAQIVKVIRWPQSIDVLIGLIVDYTQKKTQTSLLVSFLSLYLKTKYQSTSIMTSIKRKIPNKMYSDKKVISQKIMSLFMSQIITHETKELLTKPYTKFIGTLSPQFIDVRKQACQYINQYFLIHGKQNWGKPDKLQNCFYLIKAVLSTQLESSSYKDLMQNLLFNFLQISSELIHTLNQTLQKYAQTSHHNQQQNNAISYQIQWVLRVQLVTQMLFTKANPDRIPFLKERAYLSPQLSKLLSALFELYISFQGKKMLFFPEDQKITQIKISGFKMFKNTMNIIVKKKKQINHIKYIGILQVCRNFIIQCIPKICQQFQTVTPQKLSYNSRQLLKVCLQGLQNLIKLSPLMNQCAISRNKILINICLPCLVTNSKQQQLSPEQYCQLKQDIVGNQNVHNIHQAAAKIIQVYSDQIDGSLTFLVQTLINTADYGLTADPSYCKNFTDDILSSPFFHQQNVYTQVQVTLMVLGILSYTAEKRDDLNMMINDLFIRRQQFFSRIDLPPGLLVSFYICAGYYLSNIFELIVYEKVSRQFYRSFAFHCVQIARASINPHNHQYIDNKHQILSIQAVDFIENCVTQPKFFVALFPLWDSNSTDYLLSFFSKICDLLPCKRNLDIVQNILIDFYKEAMDRHKDQKNYEHLPKVMKKQLAYFLAEKIIENFQANQQIEIFKIKIFQLYHILTIICEDPESLVKIGQSKFQHVIEVQFSHMTEVLDIYQTLVRRSYVEQFEIKDKNLMSFMANSFTKATKIVDRQTFETVLFDAFYHMIHLNYEVDSITVVLLEIFQSNLKDKDYQQDAQMFMQKVTYLLNINIYLNGHIGSSQQWLRVFDTFLEYTKNHYRISNSIILGKVLCYCLCCYDLFPSQIQQYLGYNRTSGLWDCILDDIQKYLSKLQKKIVCLSKFVINIELQSLFIKNPSTEIIKNNAMRILETIAQLIFFHYQKQYISWNSQYDLSESDSAQNGSSQGSADANFSYIPEYILMRKNEFIQKLPDEISIFRDICKEINRQDHAGFSNFLKKQPIAIQSMIKNKIILYQQERIPKNIVNIDAKQSEQDDFFNKNREDDKKNGDTTKKNKKLRNIFKVKKQL